MNYSKDLIKQAQDSGLKTTEIAKIIGTNQPWVSRVKAGDKRLAEEHVIKLAKVLGINQQQALVNLQIETAKTEEERKLWVKLLKTLIATSTLVSASTHAAIANCVECIFIKHIQWVNIKRLA